jgi:hypothetical protein
VTSLVCISYPDQASSAKIQYAERRRTKTSGGTAVMLALLGDISNVQDRSVIGAIIVNGSFKVAINSCLLFRTTPACDQRRPF